MIFYPPFPFIFSQSPILSLRSLIETNRKGRKGVSLSSPFSLLLATGVKAARPLLCCDGWACSVHSCRRACQLLCLLAARERHCFAAGRNRTWPDSWLTCTCPCLTFLPGQTRAAAAAAREQTRAPSAAHPARRRTGKGTRGEGRGKEVKKMWQWQVDPTWQEGERGKGKI